MKVPSFFRSLILTIGTSALLLGSPLPQKALAAGYDGSDETDSITYKDSGRTLVLAGFITPRMPELFKNLPRTVERVEIASYGGDVNSAIRMAEIIRARRLEVHVPTICWSACTLLFQSGTRRMAEPSASFMYHRVQFHGDPAERARYQRRFSEAYLRYDMDPKFVVRIEASEEDLYFEAKDLPPFVVDELVEERLE